MQKAFWKLFILVSIAISFSGCMTLLMWEKRDITMVYDTLDGYILDENKSILTFFGKHYTYTFPSNKKIELLINNKEDKTLSYSIKEGFYQSKTDGSIEVSFWVTVDAKKASESIIEEVIELGGEYNKYQDIYSLKVELKGVMCKAIDREGRNITAMKKKIGIEIYENDPKILKKALYTPGIIVGDIALITAGIIVFPLFNAFDAR